MRMVQFYLAETEGGGAVFINPEHVVAVIPKKLFTRDGYELPNMGTQIITTREPYRVSQNVQAVYVALVEQ